MADAEYAAMDAYRATGVAQAVYQFEHEGENEFTGEPFRSVEFMVCPLGEKPVGTWWQRVAIINTFQESLL
jgi:hypothetical protein